MKGALAWNERPVNINKKREWHTGCVNVRVKLGHQVDYPLRDLGNNPLQPLYLLLSLKHGKGRAEANTNCYVYVLQTGACVWLSVYAFHQRAVWEICGL